MAKREKFPDDWVFAAGYEKLSFAMCRELGPIVAVVYSRMRGYFRMGKGTEDYGICFAARDRIAAELGLHRNTVNKAVRILEKHGYIKWVGTRGRPGTYEYTWVGDDGFGEPIEGGE